jgi:hypothetical protein
MEFTRIKLLLESDSRMPSVASLVAGERIKGSWWGHAKGREIWRALNEFTERRDVLTTRLVSGKVTFVHRSLWDDFIAIASSKEKWQTWDLSDNALRLLRLVEGKGELRTDVIAARLDLTGKIGDTARELERKLLTHSEEVHTEKGLHAKVLQSWSYWLRVKDLQLKEISVAAAKSRFEAIVGKLNREYGAEGTLLWVVKPDVYASRRHKAHPRRNFSTQ